MSSQSRRDQLRVQRETQLKKERRARILIFSIGAVAVLTVAALVAWAFLSRGPVGDTVPPNANKDKSGIVVNPSSSASAPLLVVYQDYQCPWCKEFHNAFNDSLNEYIDAGTVRVEYRTMTFLDQNFNNDASLRAGVAAACADVEGYFKAYHDEIYANQPATEGQGYTDDLLRNKIPATIGLTGSKLSNFQQCYAQRATEGFVNGTQSAATKAGITGTPAYWLNGKDITSQLNYQTPSTLSTVLDKAIG